MLFVVIDLFSAALAACLCGWLIRSARHGTADNDDGHGDDACVWRRVLGGFGGRPLGRAQDVRSCLTSCHLVGWCLGVGRFTRSLVLLASASVASALLRDGWARMGGWVGK
jgi:hypothetical protein